MRKLAHLVLPLALFAVCQVPLAAQEPSLPEWLTLASAPLACESEGALTLAVPNSSALLCVNPASEVEGIGGCWCCAKTGDPTCCASCFENPSLQRLTGAR